MISVIIPVYNAAHCIEECVASVLANGTAVSEIILVNDGSTDDSGAVCRRLAEGDARICYMEQENAGVSHTRNVGLRAATAKYVLFVDADDLIAPQMAETLSSTAERTESDLVVCSYLVEGDGPRTDIETLRRHAGEISSADMLTLMIGMRGDRIRENMWRCLFLREMLLDAALAFRGGMKMGEDYLFFMGAVNAARRVTLVPEQLYIYRFNTASATARYMPTLHDDMCTIDAYVQSLCASLPQLETGYLERRALTLLRTMQNMCLPHTPYTTREAIRISKSLYCEEEFKRALKTAYRARGCLSGEDRLSITLLRFGMVSLYIRLYKFYKKHR